MIVILAKTVATYLICKQFQNAGQIIMYQIIVIHYRFPFSFTVGLSMNCALSNNLFEIKLYLIT